MKTIRIFFVTAIFLVMAISLKSQDLIDPPILTGINFNDTIIDRNFSTFAKGFNWFTIGRQIDSAMKINSLHCGAPIPSYLWASGARIMYHEQYLTYGVLSDHNLQCMAFNFEPTLNVQPNNFIPKYKDSTGAVFGFLYRNSEFLKDSVSYPDPNFHRFILRKNRLDSIGQDSATVLDNSWPNDEFFCNGAGDATQNGNQWYVTINLRSLDTVQINSNDTILTIKLPYILRNDTVTRYIKFSSIPSLSINTIIGRDSFDLRGIQRNLRLNDTLADSTLFVITKRMLAVDTFGTPNRDLTIRAYFITDRSDSIPNPAFKYLYGVNNAPSIVINNLRVSVKYHGKNDIAVNWIKLMTPNSEQLFSGQLDILISDYLSLTMDRIRSAGRGIKLHRFYIFDEFMMDHWNSMRYINKLVDGLSISETEIKYPKQYEYALDYSKVWKGNTMGFGTNVAAPFIKSSTYNGSSYTRFPEVFGYHYGYTAMYTYDSVARERHLKDIVNSIYETYLIDETTAYNVDRYRHLPVPDTATIYTTNNTSGGSTQLLIEESLYNNCLQKSDLLYSPIPWWSNVWLASEAWMVYPWVARDSLVINDSLVITAGRPKTGEESRLLIYSNIILGTKGLMYWCNTDWITTGDSAHNYHRAIIVGSSSKGYGSLDTLILHDSTLKNSNTLLYSNKIGGDFLAYPDTSTLHKYIFTNRIRWDTLGHDSTRIYLGRTSQRSEIAKANSYLDVVGDSLMKLRLACWSAKGFKSWYSQDPTLNGTVMDRFINKSSVKTRPIGRQKFMFQPDGESFLVNHYEPWDSSFIDLTILRDSSDHNLTGTSWVVGVQNRRTDPLLYFQDTQDTSETSPSIKFYSTYELDTRARYGGNTLRGQFHDRTWWRQKYWQRIGCREVTIPMNYQQLALNEYCLLRVTELGVGTSLDTDTNSWWFREPFKNRVDTIIGQNKSLVIKLLPGESKLLRFEVLPPGKADGYLAHSNQSKLIEYPSNASGDSIRYHLVYFKLKPGTDRNRVCYMRSYPFKKDDPNENIVWEREYLLSDTVIKQNLVGSDSLHCDYPSIVLRKSADTLKAYIVYSCNNDEIAWDYSKSFIAENVIRFVNDDFFCKQDTIGKVIAGYIGSDRKEWGNPVVNASYGGNYYSWSDSSARFPNKTQIVSAWKSPTATYFLNTNKDSVSFFLWIYYGFKYHYLFKHPSLNVYSNIDKNEDNCALVFQTEYLDSPYSNPSSYHGGQIFYTRLRRTSSGLKHYLPTIFNSNDVPVDTANCVTSITNHQNYGGYFNAFPIVIRNLGDYRTISKITPNRSDRIYWQTSKTLGGLKTKYLETRAIGLYDSSNIGLRLIEHATTSIKKDYQWLQQPNINNGYAITDSGAVVGQQLLLNFTASAIDSQPSSSSEIWQFPHYLYSGLTQDVKLKSNPLSQRMFSGQQPHLSMHRNFDNNIYRIWKNRRVYEYGSSSPPEILSSAKYFYKMVSQNEEEGDALVGFTNDSTLYYINLPLLDGLNLPIHLPYTAINDSIYETFYERYETDTLYSDWFSVGNEAQLVFKCYGYDTSRVAMKIHEQNTANYIDLSLPSYTTDSTGILREFTLYNGQGMNYRLEYTKRDTTAHYSEQIILDGLPVPDTMRKATAMFGIPIDLQGQSYHNQGNQLNLNVFPNPTDDNIYVTVYLPIEMIKSSSSLIIKVFSTLGVELFRQEVKSGETLSIDTRSYPPGAYFIRAEEKIDSFDKLPAVIENFIIQR